MISENYIIEVVCDSTSCCKSRLFQAENKGVTWLAVYHAGWKRFAEMIYCPDCARKHHL